MRVLELGAIFGILMLLWDAVTERKAFAGPLNLLATAFAAFAFGMWMVFEWRVLHGGLAILSAGVLLALLAAGFINRRSRKRADHS